MSSHINDDLSRVRQAYAERDSNSLADKYSTWSMAGLFAAQMRQRSVLTALRAHGVDSLQGKRILEVGCGSGAVLLEYLAFGAAPEHLHGTDLILDRVKRARARLPYISLTCADGQHLPYEAGSFDLVLQNTLFSSVLDDAVKANLAKEMLRVLKGSNGMILWYDFWLNPGNRDTRGIRPGEVKRLFPGCVFRFGRVTLAPPVARRIVPVSWTAASLLEGTRLLSTHYLATIQPV
jgi:ubiquinone/menaquinone biosynthesis C-methylase UbiE